MLLPVTENKLKHGHDAIQVYMYVELLCKLKHFAATRHDQWTRAIELAVKLVHTVVRSREALG